jgi:pimeloyl-ACP methyl ester carboxylesterase
MRFTSGRTAALAALVLPATAIAQAPLPAPAVDETLVPYASTASSVRLPDGRTLHLVCAGQGSPTVILAAGGGGNASFVWNAVQPGVAATTRVCSWDRAGLGLSSPSPARQTVDETTRDLEAALQAAGIAGPYVVVGHSTGGYDSLVFADRHPGEVAGMVLVDPTPLPDQARAGATPVIDAILGGKPAWAALLERCAAAIRAGAIGPQGPDPDGCFRTPPPPPDYPPALREAVVNSMAGATPAVIAIAMDDIAFHSSPEKLALDAGLATRSGRTYGSMPLVVLSAGEVGDSPQNPPEVNAELQTLLANKHLAHAQFATLSARGQQRIVAGSVHDIQHEKPQAVIDAIVEVVNEVRASR